MSPLARLMSAPPRDGTVRWIGVRGARRAGVSAVEAVALDPRSGLDGDHYRGSSGTRQVTLIAAEQIAAIASFLRLDAIAPERLRRNVVVSGLNLMALRGRRIWLGSALLAVTGECHPCSRMEEEFGVGGYNAVRGHGGLTARILNGGTVRIGDPVRPVADGGPGHEAGSERA
jgi:MOSC domain-containing protein YiiM